MSATEDGELSDGELPSEDENNDVSEAVQPSYALFSSRQPKTKGNWPQKVPIRLLENTKFD